MRTLTPAVSSLPVLLATALSVTVLCVPALPAQTRFAEILNPALPTGSDGVFAIGTGDFDGDGDEDVVLGRRTRDMLWINQGDGSFLDAPGRLPVNTGYTSGIAVGDVDGDSDLDLVIGVSRGKDRLFLNDGRGNFVDGTSGRLDIDGGPTGPVALADLDGDGDLDLLVGGGWSTSNFVALNDGRGRFTRSTQLLPNGTAQIETGDYDGDGDNDVLVRANGVPRLLLNNGRGGLVDVTSTQLPASIDRVSAMQVGDVDRDGDVDVVLSRMPGGNVLWLGDGRGFFVDGTAGRLPGAGDSVTRSLLVDLDGDRAPEIVFASDPDLALGQGRDRLFRNDGRGRFTDATSTLGYPDVGFLVRALVAVDADRDGDRDLLLGGEPGSVRLLLNDGRARLTQLNQPFLPRDRDSTNAVAAGDIDGDGDVDLVLGVLPRARLMVNDGRGRFVDEAPQRMPAITVLPPSIALQDIDGDGDLDLIHSGNTLFLNDGTGHFLDVSVRLPQSQFITRAMAFGDVDGDGDTDIVLAQEKVQNRLYLNDGRGRFIDGSARLPAVAENSYAVALGDVDGDGDLDLVVGNRLETSRWPGIDRLYLNDGTGRFQMATTLPAISEATQDLALGDFDGDGDLDLATVIASVTGPGRNRLYLNDGRGNFSDASASRLPAVQALSSALGVADLDGDGDLDMVQANLGYLQTPQSLVLINDGRGFFTDATAGWLPARVATSLALVLRDFDGDRDVDLLLVNQETDWLYFNLSQHLTGPGLVRIGSNHSVRITMWASAPAVSRVAIPAVSLQPAAVPVPGLGTLGLDLRVGIVLPSAVFPNNSQHLTNGYPIPNLPGLVGQTLYEQAVVYESGRPRTARLTNPIANRIY